MLLIAHYEAKNRGKRFKLLRDTFSIGYSRFASEFVSFFAKFTAYSWQFFCSFWNSTPDTRPYFSLSRAHVVLTSSRTLTLTLNLVLFHLAFENMIHLLRKPNISASMTIGGTCVI